MCSLHLQHFSVETSRISRLNSHTWLEATILNCAAPEACRVPVFSLWTGSFLISIPTTGISNNLKALTMIHFPVIPNYIWPRTLTWNLVTHSYLNTNLSCPKLNSWLPTSTHPSALLPNIPIPINSNFNLSVAQAKNQSQDWPSSFSHIKCIICV